MLHLLVLLWKPQGTPAELNYYEELTVPSTITGPWGVGVSYNINLTYVRIGKSVTVSWSRMAEIPAATVAAIVAVSPDPPVRFRPLYDFHYSDAAFDFYAAPVQTLSARLAFKSPSFAFVEAADADGLFPTGQNLQLLAGSAVWVTA